MVYDTGILHKLLNISAFEDLLGHPTLGASWEGFVIENIIVHMSNKWQYSYYRTASQTEIDLVLEGPEHQTWAIEVKRSLSPKVGRGFHSACADIGATKKIVVYSGSERYPMADGVEVIGLIGFLQMVTETSPSAQ